MTARKVSFIKMDGTGNDFIIIDARKNHLHLNPEQVRAIASRKNKITKGCDQVILIEHSGMADCFMRIYNSDGGEVSSCGNASRCVGQIICTEKISKNAIVETLGGMLGIKIEAPDLVTVDMGPAMIKWNEIPLAKEIDTLHLPVEEGPLSDPVGVGMGNPHAVFFVDDVDKIDFNKDNLGSKLEHHPLFPERVNVGVAEVINRKTIKLRVFERGAGETLSCGTGACAALVAAKRRRKTGRKAKIILKGGELLIEWQKNGNVLMTGAIKRQFKGTLDL